MVGGVILRNRLASFGFSLILVCLSLLCVVLKGVPMGVEFTGGTLVEVTNVSAVEVSFVEKGLREWFSKRNIDAPFSVQRGQNSLVTFRFSAEISSRGTGFIKTAISDSFQKYDFVFDKIDNIGPQVSTDTARHSVVAIVFAFFAIAAYMSIRFNWQFAVSGVLVLMQDVIIAMGFLSLSGLEFDLTMVAAFLTIIGYCINDTVVIYDRIRHNLLNAGDKDVAYCVARGIDQTIKRSIITSFVTLLAVIGILFFKNTSIVNFGFVVGFGIVVGTFGSIFVASVLPVTLGLKKYTKKEKKQLDPMFYAS